MCSQKRSEKRLYYAKKRRKQLDRCNICGNIAELTWDHVPPKFCENSSTMDYALMLGLKSSVKSDKPFPLRAQNGIKYRSLCAKCNNAQLGLQYDPSYKELVEKMKTLLTSSCAFNQTVSIRVKPNRIARAIAGHMLAAKNEYEESVIDEKLREYFFNGEMRKPEEMKLCYFIYPYQTISIVRDVCVKSYNVGSEYIPQGVFSCLYSFPVAFLLCESSDMTGLPDLFAFCTSNIDDEENIPINLESAWFPGTNIVRHPICRVILAMMTTARPCCWPASRFPTVFMLKREIPSPLAMVPAAPPIGEKNKTETAFPRQDFRPKSIPGHNYFQHWDV